MGVWRCLVAIRKRQLIGEAKERLEQILEARIDEERMTLDEIEAAVESVMREVAEWVEARLIEEQQPARCNEAACQKCGNASRFKRTMDAHVLTIHGLRRIPRRYYYCTACRQGFCPMDGVLGLESGRDATRLVRSWQAKYGSESAFAAVPELLQELRGIDISASTVERTTIEVGKAVEAAARDWEPGPPDRKGELVKERLYLSMDGTMTPLRDQWRRDGTLGKLACRYGEAKLGAVFQTLRKQGLDEGVARRGCVGTMGDVAVFRKKLLELAAQWRLGFVGELIVLADGAPWIWATVAEHFPTAIQILDYWHMTQHLWKVANAMHSSNRESAKAWVDEAQRYLNRGMTHCFLGMVRSWQPAGEEAREIRRTELAFFETNAERMRYETFLGKGYMIGSGTMESTCRQVAAQRLDRAGMHWREEVADVVLAIRAHRSSTGAPPLTCYA